MAIQIIREISADVVKRGSTRAVYAKQHDRNSRFLNIRIQEDGKDIQIESTATVMLNVERPDKQENIFYGTVNGDGTVKVPLASWMLELSGTLLCDVSIVSEDTDVAKLTTMKFNIYVEEAVVTEEYSVIVDLLIRTEAAEKLAAEAAKDALLLKENCEAATDRATKAAEAAEEVLESFSSGEGIDSVILNKSAGHQATGDYSVAQGSSVMFMDNGDGTVNETFEEVEATFFAVNEVTGKGAHAEGAGTKASAPYAHAEGRATVVNGVVVHTEASGKASHAEGNGTKAKGMFAHTEGTNTTATGNAAHAEGDRTKALGNGSHSEGFETVTGNEKPAEGEEVNGIYAHAEGYRTKAIANQSHTEGASTKTNGIASHAEGSGCETKAYGSHAEGLNTVTEGQYAHSEGKKTLAKGNMSHAEGESTEALAVASHAEGYHTIARKGYQHAEGTYNAHNDNALHMVGNGTSEDNRKNAFEVMKDGSANVQTQGRTNNSVVIIGELFNLIYPVGSIYMSVNSQNPSKIFGGTWVAWGSGRVPIGINTGDSSFNTVEKTGGSKTNTLTGKHLPMHYHLYHYPKETEASEDGTVGVNADTSGTTKVSDNNISTHTHNIDSDSYVSIRTPANMYAEDGTEVGLPQAFSIVQPYITCYMWKRTA